LQNYIIAGNNFFLWTTRMVDEVFIFFLIPFSEYRKKKPIALISQ